MLDGLGPELHGFGKGGTFRVPRNDDFANVGPCSTIVSAGSNGVAAVIGRVTDDSWGRVRATFGLSR